MKKSQPRHGVNTSHNQDLQGQIFETIAHHMLTDALKNTRPDEQFGFSPLGLEILDNIHVALFVLDPRFQVFWANKAVEEFFGISRHQVIGKDKRRLIEEKIMHFFEGPEAFGNKLISAYQNNTYMEHFRCHVLPSNGRKERWLLYRSCPIEQGPLQGGRIEHYYDITEQVAAERSFFEETERLRSLFEHTGTAIVLMEEDTTISMANSEFERLSGYAREEIEGKMSWTRFVVPEDLERLKRYHSERREKERDVPEEYEFRFINKNGEIRHILNRVGMIPGTKKSVASLLDITQRKETEKALREAEEKYRTLSEFAEACIVMIQDGETVYRNPYYEELLGYTLEDTKGKSFLEIVAPEYRQLVKEKHEKRLRGESASIPYEVEVISRSGKRITLEVRSTLVSYRGRPAVMAVMDNITERKLAEAEKERMQAQLRQAQKMEAIGTLAGGIAHDFNNILAAIVGYVELALCDMPEGLPARKNLKEALDSALRARDLIKQILAFSRGTEQERRPLRIQPVIKEALKMLRASLPKTIEIREHMNSDGVILADPIQIHQILINLCTNAAHAMEGQVGVLEVGLQDTSIERPLHVHGRELKPGNYVQLRVKDTGHGIPPELVDRIFDPYFTTKGTGEGTGLGLAVVHGIVKACDGGIAVASQIGKGSVFDVYLPRVVQEVETEHPQEETPFLSGHERILFVDDEPSLVEIGGKILSALGYQVSTTTSPFEALELFRSKPLDFDLVIMDKIMPGMPGEKLAQELLRIRPDIPIILCTGYSDNLTDEKVKDMGIRALVMKPLMIKELAQKVRETLEE
ncbi:MAG: hypothetical protein DRG76_00775 [Deltaproteobacteria bacterium]|nr:MAG: hypothetical protein DRG76_00775 [Deltaproteobacteria bacterium]